MLCHAGGEDGFEPLVVRAGWKLRFPRMRGRQIRDASGELVELLAVTVSDCDRANVKIRIDPPQISVGTAAPQCDALIEIAAGNKRVGGRIAKLRHARALYRREIGRLIAPDLGPVQFTDRRKRTIFSLRKGARNSAVFEHSPAGFEQA